ncbi:MAG TPA: DUF5803 family protein [Methanothrix sp.]|nr:DUF5803 family protein [Methanothrix sp.]HPJ83844.1 DUF5803 family protein [Methanothrix sp.]HPR65915.1 DUF5803 family protein [Methanothrix sp.]
MNRKIGFGLLMLMALFFVSATVSGTQGMEADGFNGTTYILTKSEAEVVIPANGSSFNLTLPFKSEIRLFDSQGAEVPVETEVEFRRGSYRYQVVSEESVEGHLNYTLPISDQRFVASAEEGVPVRVVLPAGYDTGDPLLGKARPGPDEAETTENRTVLIWKNPARRTIIDVNFYRDDAPRAFRLFLLLLAFLAGVLALEHLTSIRRLRSVREDAEEEE